MIPACDAPGCEQPATVLVELLDNVPGLPDHLHTCDEHTGPVLSGLWNNYLTRAREHQL